MDAVGVVVEKGLHRGKNDREVAGEASGHDGVGGGLLRCQDPSSHLDFTQNLVRCETDIVQHLRNPVHRRRNYRQAVGPAAPVALFNGVQPVNLVDGCSIVAVHFAT